MTIPASDPLKVRFDRARSFDVVGPAEDALRFATGEIKPHDPLTPDMTPKAWTFQDHDVAAHFDAHVREQLPWYDIVAQYVADLAVSFLPTGGVLYDIGASTGNMTRLLAQTLDLKQIRAVSIEPAHEMADRWYGNGTLRVIPAEQIDYSVDRPDVAVLFLVLMFMKPSEREKFLEKLFEAVTPGGAVFIVDKGYLGIPSIAAAAKTAHLAMKQRAGTPPDSYIAKELSLRGEQRPTAPNKIIELAEDYGFMDQRFFQLGEFYGLALTKEAL